MSPAGLSKRRKISRLKSLQPGGTTYENGLATAHDNVAIHIGDTDIYADAAQYNSQTHEISVDGNVRIYRDVTLYLTDHAIYNTDTKQIKRAGNAHRLRAVLRLWRKCHFHLG